jgi:hypothetical protein
VLAFAGLLALPFSWAIGAMLAAGAVMMMASAVGQAARRRAAAAAAQAERAQGGVVLGVDERGHQIVLTEPQLAAHGLIVGASGAGKSTTLLGILEDRVRRGRAVVAIDFKGSPAFADRLRRAAQSAGTPFHLWTLDGPGHWNPLANGNPTVLKDKLIGAERFTEPHYQRAAERYVQTVFRVLQAAHPGRAPQLDEVVSLMEPRRLARVLRGVTPALSDQVHDYLAGLTPDQQSAVRGLGNRLAVLTESAAGPYLLPAGPSSGETIDLRRALERREVVVFSLNSSLYGKLAAQAGALVIQDLTTVMGQRQAQAGTHQPEQAIIGVDEFSGLGADIMLALFARGREAGMPVFAATQEMTDLDRAAPGFREQVLGIVSLKIAHRQDVPASARMVSEMIGTERVWEETRTIQSPFGRRTANRGTRRQVERPIVHPNEIKTLETGQVVMISKTPVARATRLRVLPPAPDSAQDTARRAGRALPPPRDGPDAGR